jgi:hypothetical protein
LRLATLYGESMTAAAGGHTIRAVLLDVVNEFSRREHNFQSRAVLQEAWRRLQLSNVSGGDQALLTAFYDLFRTGHVSWGYDIANPDPPFMHLTEQGRRTLEHLSRDPANPDGYLAHLLSTTVLNSVADSYIREALRTYNADCFRATAVMVGAAAESIVLELRDVLVARITALGRTPARALNDWRVRRVLEALQSELNSQSSSMPNREAYEAYWPAFTQQIRAARNEAGHPSSIDPVTPETVHASLLILPELARLAEELRGWVQTTYS